MNRVVMLSLLFLLQCTALISHEHGAACSHHHTPKNVGMSNKDKVMGATLILGIAAFIYFDYKDKEDKKIFAVQQLKDKKKFAAAKIHKNASMKLLLSQVTRVENEEPALEFDDSLSSESDNEESQLDEQHAKKEGCKDSCCKPYVYVDPYAIDLNMIRAMKAMR